ERALCLLRRRLGARRATRRAGVHRSDVLLGRQAAWLPGDAAPNGLEDLQEESVERGREAPAIPGDDRVVVPELLEERDGDLSQPLPIRRLRRGDGRDDERQRSFDIARVERRDDVRELSGRASLLETRVCAWGRKKLVEKRRDGCALLGVDELLHDGAVAEGLHGRDPA